MAAFLDESLMNSVEQPQTLCDWVKNFRIKKIQMKRKYRHGSNLRICAMLTTALNNAEDELKRKQQERFNKWAEMQSKLGYYNSYNNYSSMNSSNHKNINNHNNYNYNNYNNSSSCASEVRSSYSYYNNTSDIISSDEELQQQHRNNINDLWKSELSGLDQFMKNMSSRCSVTN